jgi:hypothetical protein
MGDIIGSEAAQSTAAVHRAFNRAIAAANAGHSAQVVSPLTITLGDEFQGIVSGLEAAWRIAPELRLTLMRDEIACRFVVGVASIRTRINPERAWNMMGPGLAAARAKLNDKISENAYRFSFPDEPAIEVLADAVGEGLTEIERGWTGTQKKYLLRSRLAGQSVAQVARREKVSLGAVYKVFRAARLDYYERQSEALLRALKLQDARYGFS